MNKLRQKEELIGNLTLGLLRAAGTLAAGRLSLLLAQLCSHGNTLLQAASPHTAWKHAAAAARLGSQSCPRSVRISCLRSSWTSTGTSTGQSRALLHALSIGTGWDAVIGSVWGWWSLCSQLHMRGGGGSSRRWWKLPFSTQVEVWGKHFLKLWVQRVQGPEKGKRCWADKASAGHYKVLCRCETARKSKLLFVL